MILCCCHVTVTLEGTVVQKCVCTTRSTALHICYCNTRWCCAQARSITFFTSAKLYLDTLTKKYSMDTNINKISRVIILIDHTDDFTS